MKTHFNYVAFFSVSGRIKIGITENPGRRRNEYWQEAKRHDLGKVSFYYGKKQFKGVARIVEQSIRESLKVAAIRGHLEWFYGDPETFSAFICMTNRLQHDVCNLLCVEPA